MRHVFPTDTIYHKWAHQTQASARNRSASLFFDGPTLYSYWKNYPIARIYTHKKRGTLVLINSNSYSVTTAKHINRARHAVNHLTTVTVPYCAMGDSPGLAYGTSEDEIHNANLAYLFTKMEKLADQANRVLSVYNLEWRHKHALDLHTQAENYHKFFGFRTELKPCPSFEAQEARIARIVAPDPLRDARRVKAKETRERLEAQKNAEADARDLITNKERADKWRAEGGSYHPTCTRPRNGRRGSFKNHCLPLPDMLRVEGETVETSQGASIPLEHAKRAWKIITRVMERGERYEHNGHTIHIGDFRIDSIETDGTVKAGCHVIKFDEIRRLAIQLGLDGVAPCYEP